MNLPEYLEAVGAAHRGYRDSLDKAAVHLEEQLREIAAEFHGDLAKRVELDRVAERVVERR